MKKLITLLTLFCLLFNHPAIAQEKQRAQLQQDESVVISPMKTGDPAPFDGVLFSIRAAAIMIVNEESCAEKTDIEVDRATNICQAHCEKKLSDSATKCTTDASVCSARVKNLQRQNKYLQQEINKRSEQRKLLWVGVGVTSGVVGTSLIALVITSLSHADR